MLIARRIAHCLLVIAIVIDCGLLAYYASLSLDNIDALWQMPFIFAYAAGVMAGLALLVLVSIRPRAWMFIYVAVFAIVIPVGLLRAVHDYVFLW